MANRPNFRQPLTFVAEYLVISADGKGVMVEEKNCNVFTKIEGYRVADASNFNDLDITLLREQLEQALALEKQKNP